MNANAQQEIPPPAGSARPGAELPSETSSNDLFRDEVLDETKADSAFGPVIALTPVSLQLFAMLVAGTLVLLLAFAALVPVARTERIEGLLATSAGMVTLPASIEGVVNELRVGVGERVSRNQPLLTIRKSGTGGIARGARRAAYEHLIEEQRLHAASEQRKRNLLNREIDRLGGRHADANVRVELLRDQLATRLESERLQQKQVERFEQLHVRGDIATSAFDEVRLQRQSARQAVQELREQLFSARSEARDAKRAILESGERRELQTVSAQQSVLSIEKQLDELALPDVVEVDSPVDGRVTAINRLDGQTVAPGANLLRIMPSKGELIARFLVPSSLVGLLEPDQPATLRFDAFPHERYGSQQGVLRSVTPTALDDRGAGAGGSATAPTFLVEVELEHDTIRVEGAERALLPDMAVSGSVELERRTLARWAFASLDALRERAGLR